MTALPTFELEMDKFGRIVIPKKLREALNLRAGSKLKAGLDGAALKLEAQAPRYHIESTETGWPVVHFTNQTPWPADHDPIKDCPDERDEALLRSW